MPITETRCTACGWFLHDDGTCRECQRRAERVTPTERLCAPYMTWPRELRAVVFDALVLRSTQTGTEADRKQRTWEVWLRSAAMDGGVIPRNGRPIPIADVLDLMLIHLNLTPATVGTE